jgi:protein-L-isoaspartate(D-aspartate) O-methyltransferase
MRAWILALAVLAVSGGGCPRHEPGGARGVPPSDAPRNAPAPAATPDPAPFAERSAERERLVREALEAEGIRDPLVLAAMRRVPRHAFVPADVQREAYADRPLPIGSGQTISQPYIVAFMTQAVAPRRDSKCLEIGTGSGYQAAVLAEICARTFSIEYLPELARFGERNLRRLGYGPERVRLRVGDGYRGWPQEAPFDAILVTAAPDHVPQPLLDQLAVGGRLVIPVGPDSDGQDLERYTRVGAGAAPASWSRQRLIGVRFVPFLGDAGFRRR